MGEFWPEYLAQHRHPVNRALHVTGTVLATGLLVAGAMRGDWRLLVAAPLAGYGLAWFGHFVVEKNRPKSFEAPLRSLVGDFRMAGLALCGRLGAEVERRRIGPLFTSHGPDTTSGLHCAIKCTGNAALRPSHPLLRQVLDNLLAPGDAVLRARAENHRFEERVGSDRQTRYEAEYVLAGPTYEDWLESHADYLADSIHTHLPETFLAVNADATLPPDVTSERGESQVLVRIESLDYALTESKIGSLAELEHALAVYNGRNDPNVTAGDAKALLEEVCRSLNRNPNAIRPRFAAFAQELEDDIDAADWPERLRDRLGLAHLPPTLTHGPYPVVLMRYTVKDTAERATRLGAAHALAVPTALDSEPYEIFHPSPRGLNYGRTLNLSGAGDCNQLASEVLHLRIDYTPPHIWKVGAITTQTDISPDRLAKLREDHLFCLKYQSERDDFGTL